MNKNLLVLLISLSAGQSYAQIDLNVKLDSFLKKSKSVQAVNLGGEKVFTPQELIVSIPEAKPALPVKKVLVSPKFVKMPSLNLPAVGAAKLVFSINQKIDIPEVKPLAKINDPEIKIADVSLKDLENIANEEYKMIQALIFFEMQKKYDISMSLFIELLETTQFKAQALLQYAESAYNLGLYSEYRHKILQAIEETKDKALKQKALQSIVQNIKFLETSDMEKIDPLIQDSTLDVSQNDEYLYKQAKYYINRGNLGMADAALSDINPKSSVYMDSVILSTSLNYRKGDLNTSISKLEKIVPTIENDKKNKSRNVLILTLARLYFQKGKYKESYQNYLKIDRSSSLWLQAMIEQAWAQILVGDHIGAAGNMFSLHTEYFKKSYVPESYIVRSVGYLNLCQYGDAMHVLTDLHSRFEQTRDKLVKFQSENKTTLAYYDLVKAWFTNTNQSEYNSVPRSFVVELAAHPSFTNIQRQMNNYEDENQRFTKLISDFSNREQTVRQRMQVNKNELQTLKNQKASNDLLQRNETRNVVAEIEIQIINRNKEILKKMRDLAQARLDTEKSALRGIAAQNLKTRYNDFLTVLTKLLEQEEVLAYEIYSGAGEHIRYQMAGGKIDERNPTALTPEEKNSYKWKFRGEVWEDEIGHYRSSLKNVCANDELAQTKGDQ
ncbi:MAG: hypothetical protein ABL930_11175 [Pseudobdellovibrio sp.]